MPTMPTTMTTRGESAALDELLSRLERLCSLLETAAAASRPPEFYQRLVGPNQPAMIDYRERRHLFVWAPAAVTLQLPADLGQLALAAGSWTNVGLRQGTPVTASTTTLLLFKATDEVAP